MRKIVYVVGGFAAFAAITFTIAFALTASLNEQAETFLASLKNPETDIGPLLSSNFKESVKPETFRNLVARFALNSVINSSWSSRSVENSVGNLKGEVTVADGRVIPLELGFIKEDDNWKLLSIDVVRPGLIADPAKLSVPAAPELTSLASQSMNTFAQALKQKDFTDFYQTISGTWRINSTPESFKKAFEPLLNKNPDFTMLANHNAALSEPAKITADGILVITGNFPSAGDKDVKFSFRYVNEFNQWKFSGLNILPVAEEQKSNQG